jgi:hypothetical protein
MGHVVWAAAPVQSTARRARQQSGANAFIVVRLRRPAAAGLGLALKLPCAGRGLGGARSRCASGGAWRLRIEELGAKNRGARSFSSICASAGSNHPRRRALTGALAAR